MNALVSILVPIHGNRLVSGLALESLRSITAQTYTAIEVIVIDDGVEGDLAMLEELRGVRVVGDGTHRGLAGARNLGLDAARGEYILPFDSDDLMRRDMVERLLDAARGADGAYSFYYRLHPDGTRCEIRKPVDGHSIERMLVSETIPHQTLLHRRIYERGDVRYDERDTSAVDLEIKLQWMAAGARLRCVQDFLFTHRLHEHGQETGTRRQMEQVEVIRARWRGSRSDAL